MTVSSEALTLIFLGFLLCLPAVFCTYARRKDLHSHSYPHSHTYSHGPLPLPNETWIVVKATLHAASKGPITYEDLGPGGERRADRDE